MRGSFRNPDATELRIWIGDVDDFDEALTNWLEWKYGLAGIGSHC